jgi:ERCC4-type nuclease
MNASKEELMTVEGIGEKMASRLVELFLKEYGKGK